MAHRQTKTTNMTLLLLRIYTVDPARIESSNRDDGEDVLWVSSHDYPLGAILYLVVVVSCTDGAKASHQCVAHHCYNSVQGNIINRKQQLVLIMLVYE